MKPLILSALLMLVGCEQNNESRDSRQLDGDGHIVKIRNCEYIESHVYFGTVYQHAGDCPNPKHGEKP